MSFMDNVKKINDTKITRMVDGNLRVENAVVIFRNFSGAPTTFNPNGGKRTFSLCLPAEWAEILKADGWNVKAREVDDGETIYHTEIVVNENSTYPPNLYMLTEFNGEKRLTPLTPDILMYQRVKKGYLKNLWATLHSVNDFNGKYAGIPINGGN